MNRARVLCVDDEQNVLDGLQRVLRPSFDVSVSASGQAALERIEAGEEFDIVVSDMRMPNMNGAQLLAELRARAPDTVRILLTGHSDLESAIAAVNEGHIFRFLTKPCAPHTLSNTLRAAALQRRLLTAERVLLEQTLVGSIRALSEVLALTHPESFGLTPRQHERARQVAERVGLTDAWHVEAASMLASVSYVVLPSEVVAKLSTSTPLDPTERQMVERLPAVVESILSHIPRLESVRDVLKHVDPSAARGSATNLGTPVGARILSAVQELGQAEARLGNTQQALEAISSRRDFYGANVFEALVALCAPRAVDVEAIPLSKLAVGMVLVDAVKSTAGMVVAAAGQRVTPQLIERLRNIDLKLKISEPIRCEVPKPAS
ncbi:MAG: response regulator [Polyangiaceae bacterium]